MKLGKVVDFIGLWMVRIWCAFGVFVLIWATLLGIEISINFKSPWW